MNKDLKFYEFLLMCRRVTNNYQEAGKKWDDDNEAKIKEELKEFLEPTDRLNELEEFWDVFFACLTRLHLKDYDEYAIFESANSTWNKIYERSTDLLNDNMVKKNER